jgi:hypothetical protein
MRNPPVFYGEIAVKPPIACAVDQPAAVNDNVEFRHFVLLTKLSLAAISPDFYGHKLFSAIAASARQEYLCCDKNQLRGKP